MLRAVADKPSTNGSHAAIPTPPRRRSAALLPWLVVVLLALACFLQWRLVDASHRGAARASAQEAPLTAPPLPAPHGSSAQAMLNELDSTSRRFTGPLRDVQQQLGTAVTQLSFVRSLPSRLDQIAHNTNGFGTVPSDLHRIASEARALGGVGSSLAATLAEIRSLSAVVGSVDAMNARVRGIATTFSRTAVDIGAMRDTMRSTLPEAVATMHAMAADLARIRRCTEEPGVCNVNAP